MNTQEYKEARLNIRLSPELKSEFKEYCLCNGIDMSRYLRDFMKRTIRQR